MEQPVGCRARERRAGEHQVTFYGNHTRDIQRYCRFAQIRLIHEGTDEPQKVDGLDGDPRVHA